MSMPTVVATTLKQRGLGEPTPNNKGGFMFDSETAELEFLLNHPFIGGDNEGEGEGEGGDEKGDQGEGKGDQKSGEEGRDTGETGGEQPPKDGKWIPKHRFDEVNQGYTKYKGLGTAEEIQKKLTRLSELEALPQNRLNDKEKTEIRKELLHVFPELQIMSQMLEVQREAYTDYGKTVNETFLKELGIEVNDSTNQYLQELLSGVIAADKKLLRRFYAMDQKVFADAFAVAKKTFWPNVKKVVPGANLQVKKVAPKAPTNQKPDEKKEEKKETNGQLGRLEERALLDDASEKAFELLEANRSE